MSDIDALADVLSKLGIGHTVRKRPDELDYAEDLRRYERVTDPNSGVTYHPPPNIPQKGN